jgi:hypothetical protein
MPPLLFSPHDPHTLYLGTQDVLKTTDGGKTWQPISPDLTGWDHIDASEHNPDKPRPPAINALSASTLDASVMWAATTNRLVQVTRDGGQHWQKVTPPGLAWPQEILYVEPSHHNAGTAYLAVGTSRQAVPPQILRTRDFGATWQSIIDGLPADQGVLVVREDRVRKGLLFAGTTSSVFVSFDDGDHWRPLTLDLPATPVTDMEIHGDDLVISTYGRGLWILDNISPIRQLTPEVLSSAQHLFVPPTAMRVRWDTNQDTPLPIETPSGKNPPDGVGIDYYLKASLAEAPSITIRDAGGNIVRKFTGKPTEPDLPLPNVPEYWFATPQPVDGTHGLHRFIWDLRYDSPRILPASYYGPILEYTEYTLADHAIPHETPRQQPQGPLVVPGRYTVELTAGGSTVKQALTVELDPRVHATPADLEAQLALARRILGGIEASYSEYQKQKALKAAVEERAKAHSADTTDIEKLLKAVQEGTREAPGLGAINRDLTRLLDSVDAADQRPTEPQIQAVNQTCNALVKAMSLWKTLNENLRKQNPMNLPIATEGSAIGCGK